MDDTRGAFHEDAHPLDVGVAPLAGDVVGVADLSTELRPLTAYFASRRGHETLSLSMSQFVQMCAATG